MALIKKRLSPAEVVELYFHVKEDVSAFDKLATAETPAIRELAEKNISDIKDEIKMLAKQVKRTRKHSVAEQDDYEDMMTGRIDDDTYQSFMDKYTDEILLMNTVGVDTDELKDIIEDYDKVFAGELDKARSFKFDHTIDDYDDYVKQAIVRAERRLNGLPEYSDQTRKPILKGDTLTAVGMAASAAVAATNPILGSTLMVSTLIASKNKSNERTRG